MKKRKSEINHPAYKYGSDAEYLHWLSFQASCLSGEFNQYIDGVGRNIACHVRRANNSGTGIKPPFSAVPLTDAEHKYQHQHGEREALIRYQSYLTPEFLAKEWFNDQAKIHLERWIEERSNR